MVFRTLLLCSGARRVPLIKFRKGGVSSVSPQASQTANTKAATAAPAQHAIEDWELPARYWRKPIDPVEMEYINRGGPA